MLRKSLSHYSSFEFQATAQVASSVVLLTSISRTTFNSYLWSSTDLERFVLVLFNCLHVQDTLFLQIKGRNAQVCHATIGSFPSKAGLIKTLFKKRATKKAKPVNDLAFCIFKNCFIF